MKNIAWVCIPNDYVQGCPNSHLIYHINVHVRCRRFRRYTKVSDTVINLFAVLNAGCAGLLVLFSKSICSSVLI